MPKPPLSVRLPEINGETPLMDEIRAIARSQGVPVNQFVLGAILDRIADFNAGQPACNTIQPQKSKAPAK